MRCIVVGALTSGSVELSGCEVAGSLQCGKRANKVFGQIIL